MMMFFQSKKIFGSVEYGLVCVYVRITPEDTTTEAELKRKPSRHEGPARAVGKEE